MELKILWPFLTWTTLWVCWGPSQVRGASPPAPPPRTVPPHQHGVTSKARGQQAVRVKRKAADSTQLWPDAVVPYSFLSPEPEREVVLAGLKHWEQRTCLRFLPANDTDLPHLQFRRLSGCRSGVGIEGAAGQNISIGDNCNKVGIVVHEVGHAVGLYHEIRRPDRDSHVVVNEANILPHELYNFYKLHWLDVTVKYDLSSVMHYHTLEWSANGRTTVATRDPMLQGVLGGWKRASSLGLSHRDAFLANHIYGCLEEWLGECGLKRNPCKNDGYLGADCTCVCPPGTTGRTCGSVDEGYYKQLESPCSQQVTYPTTLTSPYYPSNYDADTWCVYHVEAPECQAPEVTVVDLQLGPRDHRDHCYTDYLEVRNASLYDGFLVCGSEVTPGTVWRSSSSTLILYFRGEVGGFRGFRLSVNFASIPGCCQSHSNNTSSPTFYLHSPSYPALSTAPFTCSYSLPTEVPARVVVKVKLVKGKGERRATPHDPTCALTLCQPDGRCSSFCHLLETSRRRRKMRRRKGRTEEEEDDEEEEGKVVLPNVGSFHLLQHPLPAPFPHLPEGGVEGEALQVSFALEDSPCHQTLFVNRSDPRGWVAAGPRGFELVQCEWRITAPHGTHVKIVVERLQLPEDEEDEGGEGESYLCVNEAGEASFPSASTRVLRKGRKRRSSPLVFVSLKHSVRIAFQASSPSASLRLRYQLYECDDDNSECRYWAADEECDANPLWMAPNCPRACRKCEFSTTCEDQHSDCAFWAKHDQCRENQLWMTVHCKRSCGHCETCEDNNHRCERWAKEGECEANREYMQAFCPLSCGDCELPNTTTTNTSTTLPTTTTTTNTTATTTTTTTAATTTVRGAHARRRGNIKRVSNIYEDNETTRDIRPHHKIRKKGKKLKNPRFLKPGRTKVRKISQKVKENVLRGFRTSPRSHLDASKGVMKGESAANSTTSTTQKGSKNRRRGNTLPHATVEEEEEEEGKENEKDMIETEEEVEDEETTENKMIKEREEEEEREKEEGSEEEMKEEDEQNQENKEMKEDEDAMISSTQISTLNTNSLSSQDAEDPMATKGEAFLKDLIRNQHQTGGNKGNKENEVTQGNNTYKTVLSPSTTTSNDLPTRRTTTSWRRRRRRNRRRKNHRKEGRQWRDGGNRPQKARKWRKERYYHRGERRSEERKKSGGRGKEGRKRRKDGNRRGHERKNARDRVTPSPPTTTTTAPALSIPFTPSLENSNATLSPELTLSSSSSSSVISSLTATFPANASSPPTYSPSSPPSSLPSVTPSPRFRYRQNKTLRRPRNRLLHLLQDKQDKPHNPKGHQTPQHHRITPQTPHQGPETQLETNTIREVGRTENLASEKTEIFQRVTKGFSHNVRHAVGSEEQHEGVKERRRSKEERMDMDAGRLRMHGEAGKEVQKSYAEWGIGPTRSVHRSRASPIWRFRKGFYRRGEHVYEDDHP